LLGETKLQVKKEKLFNIVYKITNLIDGKFYYGIHSTNKLEDGYLGGGVRITYAVKKYGRDNFKREIINHYPTRKEASWHEKIIVTEELTKDPQCYNIKTGGDNENTQVFSDEAKQKISNSLKKHFAENGVPETSQETRDKISKSKLGEKHPQFGKKLPKEWRDNLSKSLQGEKSYMFGVEKSPELKQQISKTLKDKYKSGEIIHPRLGKSGSFKKIKCQIIGIIFNSISAACRHFQISQDVIRMRLNSSDEIWKDWNFVEKRLED
jgi:group I intron endonuclease